MTTTMISSIKLWPSPMVLKWTKNSLLKTVSIKCLVSYLLLYHLCLGVQANFAPPPAPGPSLEFPQPPAPAQETHNAPPPLPSTSPQASASAQPPALDDIKVEYHRASKRPPVIYSFADFTRDEPIAQPAVPDDRSEPWKPFRSRLDFDFAELTHETRMNKGQIQRLLNIIHGVALNKDKFTFNNVDDVDLAWSKAQLLYPSVRHYVASAH